MNPRSCGYPRRTGQPLNRLHQSRSSEISYSILPLIWISDPTLIIKEPKILKSFVLTILESSTAQCHSCAPGTTVIVHLLPGAFNSDIFVIVLLDKAGAVIENAIPLEIRARRVLQEEEQSLHADRRKSCPPRFCSHPRECPPLYRACKVAF